MRHSKGPLTSHSLHVLKGPRSTLFVALYSRSLKRYSMWSPSAFSIFSWPLELYCICFCTFKTTVTYKMSIKRELHMLLAAILHHTTSTLCVPIGSCHITLMRFSMKLSSTFYHLCHFCFKLSVSESQNCLLLHPKKKILSLFTNPYVLPNLYAGFPCNPEQIFKNALFHTTVHNDYNCRPQKSSPYNLYI